MPKTIKWILGLAFINVIWWLYYTWMSHCLLMGASNNSCPVQNDYVESSLITHLGSYRNIYFIKAKQLENCGEFERANNLYKEALVLDPNNEDLLLSYGKFLFRTLGDIRGSKTLISRLHDIVGTNYHMNIFRLEIALCEMDYKEALIILDEQLLVTFVNKLIWLRKLIVEIPLSPLNFQEKRNKELLEILYIMEDSHPDENSDVSDFLLQKVLQIELK